MSKTKFFKGNFPDPEFYMYIGKHGDWKVYVDRNVNNEGFYKIKVVSMVPRPKANFYLDFGLEKNDLVDNKSRFSLRGMYPHDAYDIEEIIKSYFRGGSK